MRRNHKVQDILKAIFQGDRGWTKGRQKQIHRDRRRDSAEQIQVRSSNEKKAGFLIKLD